MVCGSSVGRAELQQSRRLDSCPHIPENCDLWTFTYSQSSVKGIHDCSSQSHGSGCMLRQHPLHYASRLTIATVGRHLRRSMCVKQCDCNNCYKKKTCADCPYCFENKDVDCNSQGVHGCKYKIDCPKVREKIR